MKGFTAVAGVLLAAALQEPTVESVYEAAERARKENKPEVALKGFRAAIARQPDHVPSHLGYQKLLQHQRKEPQLVAEYEALHKKHNAAWTCLLYGRLLHDPAKEEELYLKGLSMDPAHDLIKEELGDVYRRRRRFDKAIDLWRERFKGRKLELQDHLIFIGLLWEAGRTDELLKEYPDPKETGRDDVEALATRGAALLYLGRIPEGLALFEKAAPKLDRTSRNLGTLGVAFAKSNRVDRALPILEEAIKIDPHDHRNLRVRGLLLTVAKRSPEGVESLREAVRLEPGSSEIWSDLGAALIMMEDHENAEAAFRETIRLNPLSESAHYRMAGLSYNRRKDEACVEWVAKAIAINGQEASYHHLLGGAYERLGKTDLAKAAYERAAQLKSQFDWRISNSGSDETPIEDARDAECARLGSLAMLLADQGKPDEARARLAEALKLVPDSRLALRALARLERREGKHEAALEAYRRLEDKADPAQAPRVSLRIADSLYDLGRVAEAVEAYRKAGKLGGDRLSSFERPGDIAEALSKSAPDADRHRIAGLKYGFDGRPEYCAPRAIECIFDRWKLPASDPGKSMVGAGATEIVDLLSARKDVAFTLFLAETGVLKSLLKQGYPLLLVRPMPARTFNSAYLHVISGYDDRRQVFLIDDSLGYVGSDYAPYGAVQGMWVGLLAPPGEAAKVEAGLPGRDYCKLGLEGFRAARKPDAAGADRAWTEALKLRPALSEAHRMLGALAMDRRDSKAALARLRAATEQPDADGLAHALLGMALRDAGDTDGAIVSFEAALKLEPQCVAALFELGRLRLAKGDDQAALAVAKRAVDLDEEYIGGRFLLGVALFRLDRPKEAIRHLNHAGRIAPFPPAHYWLAQCWLKLGDKDRAVGALRKCLELEKDPKQRAQAEEALKQILD